jgi:MAF protein
MNQRRFWLASNSPRRREMLSWSHWNMETVSSKADETRSRGEPAGDYVCRLATLKSRAVLKDARADDFVIAADTIVVQESEILGKPRDAQHAFDMLANLRGRTHEVMTAVAVRHAGDVEPRVGLCASPVQMRDYSDDEIIAYIDTGDPLDKAGAYAIQNSGFHPVVGFQGCFASVMGLPLCHMERALRGFEDYEATDWPQICQYHLKYDCPITARIIRGENIG